MHPWIGTLALVTTGLALAATRASASPQEAGLPTPTPAGSATPVQEPTPPAEIPPTVAPVVEPTTPPPLVWEPRYHDGRTVRLFLEAWHGSAEAIGLTAELIELGAPYSGGRTLALRVGRATGPPLAERPALVLLGGLDGVSLTGSEGVLAVLAHVFAHPTELAEGTTLVAVPWAAPEALERALAGHGDGRDLRPVDDDGDRKVDEDGPEDLDGDGQILEMLVEDPDGPWTRGADARFLVPAKHGDLVRYRRAREGKDDDGDGRFNEDAAGGIALACSFPEGFVPAGSLATGLTLPLEDEHARSLCALLVETRPLCVLVFQGDHGGIALTRMDPPAVLANAEVVARAFAKHGARSEEMVRTFVELGRDSAPGSAFQWMQRHLGAFVAEYAPWGPEVERATNGAAPSPASARRDGLDATLARGPNDARSQLEHAWARWLDDTRGGIGFVDWHPVDLGPARRALVGGWLAYTRENAPETALPAALANVPAGVMKVLAQFPRLEAGFTEVRRDGELCFLRARIKNRGALGCGGRAEADLELTTRLVLPAGARLVAGAETQAIPPLAGGEASRELAWIVLAPPQSAFKLSVTLPWGGTAEEEVRP